MASRAEWSWKEAWLLLSVSGWRGSSLSKVIGNADAINHDIPSREDLEDGLNRLAAANLVQISGERIRLTAHGRTLLRATRARYALDQLERLEPKLAEIRLVNESIGWRLDPAVYEAAYERYRRRATRFWRRRERRHDTHAGH